MVNGVVIYAAKISKCPKWFFFWVLNNVLVGVRLVMGEWGDTAKIFIIGVY